MIDIINKRIKLYNDSIKETVDDVKNRKRLNEEHILKAAAMITHLRQNVNIYKRVLNELNENKFNEPKE